MNKRFRIVTDAYAGFEVQHKYWFWPFWIQTDFSNTFPTIEAAEAYAKGWTDKPRFVRRVVKHLPVSPIQVEG